jgi:hypothetical protein
MHILHSQPRPAARSIRPSFRHRVAAAALGIQLARQRAPTPCSRAGSSHAVGSGPGPPPCTRACSSRPAAARTLLSPSGGHRAGFRGSASSHRSCPTHQRPLVSTCGCSAPPERALPPARARPQWVPPRAANDPCGRVRIDRTFPPTKVLRVPPARGYHMRLRGDESGQTSNSPRSAVPFFLLSPQTKPLTSPNVNKGPTFRRES